MAITYRSGVENGANNAAPTLTPGVTPNAGDLVVAWIHNNEEDKTITADDAGWTNPDSGGTIPTTETARHSFWWRIAGGSEPSPYTWTLSGGAQWRAGLYVFAGTDIIADAAYSVADTSVGTSVRLICTATNGETVADNAVSIVMGGKDTRSGSTNAYSDADNSYTGVIGDTVNQVLGMAYRIYTTGHPSPLNFDVIIDDPDDNDGENVEYYSAHMSFKEDTGAPPAATPSYLTLLGVG